MIIRWFDSILLSCLYGCLHCVIRGENDNSCKHCPCTRTPTQNPSTSVCNCPTIDGTVSDYSQRPITTTRANATNPQTITASTTTESTTTASTTTSAIITITTVSEASLICPEQDEQKSCSASENQGAVIGAAIGGTIFGSIMTAIVFVFFRRRLKNPNSSKNDQTPRIVRNAAYGYNSDHSDQVNSLPVPVYSAYTEILNDGMRKSAVISPILRQEDSSKIDKVYNHLGESEKEDRSDYYDHAGPAPSLSVVEDGYGVIYVESGGNDNYNTVDGNYSTYHGELMTAESKQSDDYFILESQN